VFFAIAALLRLLTLAISRRNERELRAAGACEIGARNSTVMAVLHTVFYVGALLEGLWRVTQPGLLNLVGVGLYVLGMLMLAWVIESLGRLWTVKILLSPTHQLNRHWLFRTVRHPNYFLAILPELVGLGLALGAWLVLLIGLPLYLVSLGVRIVQEERALRARFAAY
jgi:isoprenylcysteine carboxyl methyltransferase (ICMT) family protein YpbQ